MQPVGDTGASSVSPTGSRSPRQRRDVGDRPAWRQRLTLLDAKVTPYVFVSPFFLLFLVVGMFPLGYTAWVSVHDWGLLSGQGEFNGLDNYRRVLEDRYFWNALRNTISIFVLSSVPQVLIALALAGLLDTQLRARTLWRMSVLLPFVVAPAAVALIFGNVFGDRYGLANDEALAYELAARACDKSGRTDFAKLFARNAYHAYMRWGAAAKTNQLEREFHDGAGLRVPVNACRLTLHGLTGAALLTASILLLIFL